MQHNVICRKRRAGFCKDHSAIIMRLHHWNTFSSFLLSSSPTREIHRSGPPQSSLPERDREWLVREGKPTSDSPHNFPAGGFAAGCLPGRWKTASVRLTSRWLVCAVIPAVFRREPVKNGRRAELPVKTGLVCLWCLLVPEAARPFRTDFTLVKAFRCRLEPCGVPWCLNNQITCCCPSLSFSPSISLSVSPPLPTYTVHSWIHIRPLHPRVPWLGMFICMCVCLHFSVSSLNSCMTCMLYVSACLVTPTSCRMGLFGCKCLSICLSFAAYNVSICNVSGSVGRGERGP